jgi:hypothetical protein
VKFNVIFTLPIVIALVVFQDIHHANQLTTQYEYDWAQQLQIIFGLGISTPQDWVILFGWSVVFTLFALTILLPFLQQENNITIVEMSRFIRKRFFGTYLGMSFIILLLFFVPWYWQLVLLFVTPFIFLLGPAVALGNSTFGQKFRNGFQYGSKAYGPILLALIVFSIILFLFAQPIAFVGSYQVVPYMKEPEFPDLLDLLADFIKMVSRNYFTDFITPSNIVRQLIYCTFMFFMLPFFIIMGGFIYFDVREKETAIGLRNQFAQFGKRKRNQETAADFE